MWNREHKREGAESVHFFPRISLQSSLRSSSRGSCVCTHPQRLPHPALGSEEGNQYRGSLRQVTILISPPILPTQHNLLPKHMLERKVLEGRNDMNRKTMNFGSGTGFESRMVY